MTTPHFAPPAGFTDSSTRQHEGPETPKSFPRPRGVFWARTSSALGSRFCEDMGHPVTTGMHTRPLIGKPGETEAVAVYACAVCWGGRPLPPAKDTGKERKR